MRIQADVSSHGLGGGDRGGGVTDLAFWCSRAPGVLKSHPCIYTVIPKLGPFSIFGF